MEKVELESCEIDTDKEIWTPEDAFQFGYHTECFLPGGLNTRDFFGGFKLEAQNVVCLLVPIATKQHSLGYYFSPDGVIPKDGIARKPVNTNGEWIEIDVKIRDAQVRVKPALWFRGNEHTISQYTLYDELAYKKDTRYLRKCCGSQKTFVGTEEEVQRRNALRDKLRQNEKLSQSELDEVKKFRSKLKNISYVLMISVQDT